MMRIGVVSDIHLSRPEDLPQEILRAFAEVDLILHAGDLVQLSILEELKKAGPKVVAVCGNMDSISVKRTLPDRQIIQAEQFRIGLTHGIGAPANVMETVKRTFKDEQVDCIVYGHSHSPQNEVHEGILYFNPGSPTDKVYAPYNSYGILEIDKKITGKIIKLEN